MMIPTGTLTTVHQFDSTDGGNPSDGVIQASDGNFYGTAGGGGGCTTYNGCGTIFEITSTGTLTTPHYFDTCGGALPNGLVQHTNETAV